MSDRDERAERLAAQLRENLKRRKAQSREGARAAADDQAPVTDPTPHSDRD